MDIWKILDQIVIKAHTKGYGCLKPEQRTAYLITQLDAEIPVNGLAGYYYSTAGNHSVEAVEALKILGCPESAAILNTANQLFPEGKPSGASEKRRIQLKALNISLRENLQELGQLYLDRPDNLSLKFEHFLNAHANKLNCGILQSE